MRLLSLLGAAGRERLRQAEILLKFIQRVARGAKNLADARRRIAEGAQSGDLDDVIAWAQRLDEEKQRFIQGR